MNDTEARTESRFPRLLYWTDQACCAALLALALAAMITSWVYQGGLRGGIIDVDKADRRPLLFQLEVNGADWPEWSLLPGIGPTLARRIVDHRREWGPFRRPEDLLTVRGIGPRTLDRLRPFLVFSDAYGQDGT